MTVRGDIDFRTIAPAVARVLWGPENKSLSSRNELRFGTRGSVSVPLTGEKRGGFFDHEAGVGGGVLEMIRHKAGCANGAAIEWLRSHGFIDKTAKKQQRQIVATYTYTNASGTPLYRKLRFHPKTFVFERADGRGGWIGGKGVMDGVQRTLYRLSDIMRAPATTTIYLCEGEKGADRLAAQLVLAVSAGGASSWRAEFAEHLRGRRVVILPDHDKAGYAHAEAAARSLASVAESVTILSLPGLAPGSDVADWLAAGGTAEDLEELAAAAPAWQPQETAAQASQPADDTPLPIVDPTILAAVPVPLRRWIVADWLPVGHVTLNYGDGGTGKTLLAQQLMTSSATGALWCGREVMRCRSLALFCEDDVEELHRRQDAVNRHLGIDFSALADMRWMSGVGRNNLLITFERDGIGKLTALFAKLAEAAVAFGARLVVVDTAADTFGGNENDRTQVRQFLGFALTGLARQIDGAVLLNAHPSRSGLSATGDLDGGSTAWSNSARSRWSLVRSKAQEGAEADADERILTRRKANYAAIGEEIRLRWQGDLLVPTIQSSGSWMDGANEAMKAQSAFLSVLDMCTAAGIRVSASPNASNYAPKVMLAYPDARGFGRKALAAAMAELFAAGVVRMAEYGRKGDARQCIARATKAAAEVTK